MGRQTLAVAGLCLAATGLTACGDATATTTADQSQPSQSTVAPRPSDSTGVRAPSTPPPSGPLDLQSLVCADEQHGSGIWDNFSGRGTPVAEMPTELERMRRAIVRQRWPDAVVTVGYQDADRLDAVATTASGDRVAVFTYVWIANHAEWQLSFDYTC
jgi:hypothetical protein